MSCSCKIFIYKAISTTQILTSRHHSPFQDDAIPDETPPRRVSRQLERNLVVLPRLQQRRGHGELEEAPLAAQRRAAVHGGVVQQARGRVRTHRAARQVADLLPVDEHHAAGAGGVAAQRDDQVRRLGRLCLGDGEADRVVALVRLPVAPVARRGLADFVEDVGRAGGDHGVRVGGVPAVREAEGCAVEVADLEDALAGGDGPVQRAEVGCFGVRDGNVVEEDVRGYVGEGAAGGPGLQRVAGIGDAHVRNREGAGGVGVGRVVVIAAHVEGGLVGVIVAEEDGGAGGGTAVGEEELAGDGAAGVVGLVGEPGVRPGGELGLGAGLGIGGGAVVEVP